MVRWLLLGGLVVVGCAEGEPAGARVPGNAPLLDAVDDGFTSGEPGDLDPDADEGDLAWSVDVAPGTLHRLDAAIDFAVVLAASREEGVSVERWGADGTRAWTVRLPELAGSGAIALGLGVDGGVAVAGPPADGSAGVVVTRIDDGAPAWTVTMAGEAIAVRDVAVHGQGKVAVVAEDRGGDLPQTVFEIFGTGGGSLQRELFAQPDSVRAVVAQDDGFVLVGDGGNRAFAELQTWIRAYSAKGFLEYVDIMEVGFTGAWTRYSQYDGANVWIGGIVDEDLSCVLPVSPNAEQDMKESPLPIPIAMTPDDEIVTIEDGVVVLQAETGTPHRYAVGQGDAVEVAAGPREQDAVFVLSEGPEPMVARLHRLPL